MLESVEQWHHHATSQTEARNFLRFGAGSLDRTTAVALRHTVVHKLILCPWAIVESQDAIDVFWPHIEGDRRRGDPLSSSLSPSPAVKWQLRDSDKPEAREDDMVQGSEKLLERAR